MTWQIALILNIFFGTIRSSIAKKMVHKIDPLLMIFHLNILSIPLYLSLYYFENGQNIALFPSMMLLGCVFYLGCSAFLYASKISLSKSVVYGSYYLVIVLLLAAIFLGEWALFDPRNIIGGKNILGLLLAVVSMYIIFSSDSKKEKTTDTRWLVLMAFNILTMGVGSYLSKLFLLSHSPIESLFSQVIGIIPLSAVAIFVTKQKVFNITKKNYLFLFIQTIFDFLTLIFYYIALKEGPIVLVMPIQTVALTISLSIIGLVLFGEAKQMTRKKAYGLALGVFGVIVLVLGQ